MMKLCHDSAEGINIVIIIIVRGCCCTRSTLVCCGSIPCGRIVHLMDGET